jgi:hypothetical protein
MHNLMVSFEIRDWQHQGALIVAAIEELGPVTRIFGSTWYVCSSLGADEAALRVRDLLGQHDGLMIADLANNLVVMVNVDDRTTELMQRYWHREDGPDEATSRRDSQPTKLIVSQPPAESGTTKAPRTAA